MARRWSVTALVLVVGLSGGTALIVPARGGGVRLSRTLASHTSVRRVILTADIQRGQPGYKRQQARALLGKLLGRKSATAQPEPPVEAQLKAAAPEAAAAPAEAAPEATAAPVDAVAATAAAEPPEAAEEAVAEEVVAEKTVEEDKAEQDAPPASTPGDFVEKEMVVARPLAEVLDAVTDFPKYSLWVSGQKEVIDETPAGQTSPQVWKFKAGVPFGPSISYTLSYTITGNQMNWVSVAGGVKSIVGEYRLTAIDDTHTQVNYKLEVDAGFGVPPALRKVVTGLVVGAALPELKRYLETKYAGIASSTSRPR